MSDSCEPQGISPGRRRGAVAVVLRQGRFLVIRRSQRVVAPQAYCFPGGAIEAGESDEQALIREMREELGVAIRPLRRVWESVTPWGVSLAWWQSALERATPIRPNPAEVECACWCTPEEMIRLPGLLASNLAFLKALAAGQIELATGD